MSIVYYELSSIEKALGINARHLYHVSNTTFKRYHKACIQKMNGGQRELMIPDEDLKKIQRRIADRLLAYEYVSPYAKAYRIGQSIVDNALPHVGKKLVLKLDIRHFFDNITLAMVMEKVFPESKYSRSNQVLLSLLCTCEERLPQGAPSSPAISNIIFREFDNIVGIWCNERNITYTRYCDDMTFSGDYNPKDVVAFITEELREIGFCLNEKKTALLHDGQKKCVTGIIVNEKVAVAREYKKKIRQEMHYCLKFGVRNHLQHQESPMDELEFLKKLYGRVNFVLSVEKGNQEFEDYRTWLKLQLMKSQ